MGKKKETIKALVYLHTELNIVHRDLKAGNILLTAAGDVRLADFGVSAQLSPIKPACVTLIGTPYWMVLNKKKLFLFFEFFLLTK